MRLPASIGLATAALLLTANLSAQHRLIGDVDGIQGTNRFLLDGTTIELVSTSVNLLQLENLSRQSDIEFDMQVTTVSTNPTVLNVLSAVEVPEIFEMGKLRLGETDSWEVRGIPGSTTAVFICARESTRYLPLPGIGTLLLGAPISPMNQGTIGATGQFRFFFTMPNEPVLLGFEITAQALVRSPAGVVSLTHASSREIEN